MLTPLTALALVAAATLTGDPAYSEALRLYKGLEYEQAILRFEEVAVRPGLVPAEKADVLMWLGLSYAGTGDLESAKRNLRQSLVADDAIAMPASTSPRLVTLFDELRVQVKDEKAKAAAAAAAALKDQLDDRTDGKQDDRRPPPPSNNGLFVVVGGVTTGVGAFALAGAGVLGFVAFDQLAKAQDEDAFQDEAKAALDAANGSAVGALVLAPVGLALGGVGAFLLVTNME